MPKCEFPLKLFVDTLQQQLKYDIIANKISKNYRYSNILVKIFLNL